MNFIKNKGVNKIKLKILSNVLFVLSIILSGYILLKTYLNVRKLPDGVCPIDNNRPLIYFVIFILLSHLIISYIDEKKRRRIRMKITILIENEKNPEMRELSSEHGLSIYIEYKDNKILFDTGQSDNFLNNARALGINLSKVDCCIISHGHYDHGDGLRYFLEENPLSQVYIKYEAIREYFSHEKYVGISQDIINKYRDRFIFSSNMLEIYKDVYLITDMEKVFIKGESGNGLRVKENGELLLDTFKHEQMLIIRDSEGLIVFTGCSHSGIVNMLETVVKYFPDEKIKYVIGGFHFKGKKENGLGESEEYIHKVAERLKTYDVEKYYTCHCTGEKGYELLKDDLQDKIEYIYTGMSLN
jgi:7,8-dihydropterin-6-yl-methyl-4-(beta-D-ribofuranosyl)aminobenzene 5'-phosphate synthase